VQDRESRKSYKSEKIKKKKNERKKERKNEMRKRKKERERRKKRERKKSLVPDLISLQLRQSSDLVYNFCTDVQSQHRSLNIDLLGSPHTIARLPPQVDRSDQVHMSKANGLY